MVFTYDNPTFAPKGIVVDEPMKDGSLRRTRRAKLASNGYRIERVIEGEAKSRTVASGMSICTTKIAVHRDLVLRDKRDPLDVYQMGFCLEGELVWRNGEHGGDRVVGAGQACLLRGSGHESASIFSRGQTCRSVTIMFEPDRIAPTLEAMGCESAASDGASEGAVATFSLTPGIERVLTQIATCEVPDSIRSLYLESKGLEAAALFLEEAVRERECPALRHPSLSADDYTALLEARSIIERNYAHPVTIAQLSREVLLNECKLKRGFKLCFDTTVHDYVVECRMEAAHKLIERDGFKVKDAAWMVGYSNVSHFITAFQKRFGITPGAL